MPEILMSLSGGTGSNLEGMPGSARPEWTARDAAMVCAGLDQRRYAAFAYRWARDEAQYSTLWGCLFNASAELSTAERWPKRTSSGQKYFDRLVRMAIFEEWHGTAVVISRMEHADRERLFGHDPEAIQEMIQQGLTSRLRPFLLAELAGVTPALWRDELSRRYEGVRQILDGWCADAHAHVMRKLEQAQQVA